MYFQTWNLLWGIYINILTKKLFCCHFFYFNGFHMLLSPKMASLAFINNAYFTNTKISNLLPYFLARKDDQEDCMSFKIWQRNFSHVNRALKKHFTYLCNISSNINKSHLNMARQWNPFFSIVCKRKGCSSNLELGFCPVVHWKWTGLKTVYQFGSKNFPKCYEWQLIVCRGIQYLGWLLQQERHFSE